MNKYTLNYEVLDKEINAPKRIKLAEVQDRIEKVGFGIVRFFDDKNKTNLWQVDGDYIIAMYDEDAQSENTKTGSWSVESDRLNKSATIFYNNVPIKSLAFSEIGVREDEVNTFKTVLPERLANNKELVKNMLNSVEQAYRDALINKFPELK